MKIWNTGFTLIEMMVVIAVIGILVLMAVPLKARAYFLLTRSSATWSARCRSRAAPDKMTVKGENKTDVPAKFLPLKCRQ